jgi:PAS domain-containing protein
VTDQLHRRSVELITIPSSDAAFRTHVTRVTRAAYDRPEQLEQRLRRVFPRVIVRERNLSGERPAWYVYRDGGWRADAHSEWWRDETLPRVRVSPEGWLREATPTAAGLLGITPDDAGTHHFTDFIVPGTLDDAVSLFDIVRQGSDLTATVVLRPVSGEPIAIDIHTARDGAEVGAVFRLAGQVDVPNVDPISVPPSVRTIPETDVAFREYVLGALRRMPEPTTDGLALRARRLYPHTLVRDEDGSWVAERDGSRSSAAGAAWWEEPELPRVRYDAQALITQANAAARTFFGRELEGHYWQEFVTPGSTEQVSVMLEILAQVGAAESRFRMPRGDGTLMEFDSYTTVEGEEFTTTFRPAATPAEPAEPSAAGGS